MKTTTSKLLKAYRADPIGARMEIERAARSARAEAMAAMAGGAMRAIGSGFRRLAVVWSALYARRPRQARPEYLY